MADLYELDASTAYYRSTDPIANLKIRVSLEKMTTSSIVPTAKDVGQEVEMQVIQEAEALFDKEEVLIQWQQKIYGQREVDKYGKSEQWANVLEEKDHQAVMQLLAKGQPRNRIFTYVDQDEFCHQDEAIENMTSAPSESPTVLASKMSQIRRRRLGGKRIREESGIIPRINIVETEPSKESIDKKHLLPAPKQIMFIMADLSPKKMLATEDHEYVLCTLQLDSSGVLAINPDFSRGRKPYKIESLGTGREVFEFTLENCSKSMNRIEQDKEMKMYREVYNRHKDFLQTCVGYDFEMPPANVLRLVVNGEIESAKNFEYDDLYLHFFVDLPRFWKAEKFQQLSWVTQTCSSKVIGRDSVSHFSFPFEFELFYKNESYKEEDRALMPHLPMIMIEVLSLDSWNRFRTEGYCYLTVPNKAGTYKEKVNCWRPYGMYMSSELRRFFIGGSPELEDPTYTCVPSTFDKSYLSKFGFKTETTGSVDLRLNVMLQSRGYMEKKANKKSVGALLDTLGINSDDSNISNVLDAFKKARLKMMQARDAATKELLRDPKNKNV